jgi:CPA2 family monovalent cation:H+ antiporter-2
VTEEGSLIATIAVGLVVALFAGILAHRLRLPVLIGYLLAGIVIGPFTPGFVGDQHIARELAEIGVVLLMFGTGLHFAPRDLLAVRRVAVPGALAQIATATALGTAIGVAWGYELAGAMVFGLSLSVASTVVLLRALEERNALDSEDGRIAVGWLLVEDLAMVLVLVLLPALAPLLAGTAGDGALRTLAVDVALVLAKVVVFVAGTLWVGGRAVRWLFDKVAGIGSRELMTVAVLAVALGIAFGSSAIFDVSLALGAFFGGVVVAESDVGKRAAQNALPLQDAFSVLFFISVGMLFDPRVVLEHPLRIVLVLLVILLGKSLAAFAIVRLFGRSSKTALTVAASLAQIGEFSFILIGLGGKLGVLPTDGASIVLAGALFSILVNPLLFRAAETLTNRRQPLEAARSP